MPHRPHEYYSPPDLQTALSLLQVVDHRAIIISPRPEPSPYASVLAVVDLAALHLDYMAETAEAISIGAQTTLQTIVESNTLAGLADGILSEAARYSAHLGLRHLATLSGALAAPQASPELLLALLALDARVVVEGRERRTLSLAGYEPAAGELMLEVQIPRPVSAGAALARVARSPLDAAIVAAVAVAKAGALRLAVGGAGQGPIVVSGGRPADVIEAVLAEARPVADYRGSVDYRRAMAGVLARRALDAALQRRGE